MSLFSFPATRHDFDTFNVPDGTLNFKAPFKPKNSTFVMLYDATCNFSAIQIDS